jgi:quinol monooxygenase YgiN
MRSEQVYWVFTVAVDQMDKFTPLMPKLVAATQKEPGALQFEINIGDDRKTVDIFERYTDSKVALFHQAKSFMPHSKEFFAVASLTRWVIYGTPSDEFKKANADSHPIYMTPLDGFVR